MRDVEQASDGCEERLRLGDEWDFLRLCLTCGQVGCCDDSENRRATAPFEADRHPIIPSLEPGAGWRRCYVDQMLVHRPSERVDEASIPETGQR